MKDEAFAWAMSYLDDDLILQAHNNVTARQGAILWRRFVRIGAAAACLMLIFTAAWLFAPARVSLTLPGGETQLAYPQGEVSVQDLCGVQPLAVEFSVDVSRSVRIRADGGTFSLTKSGDDAPFLQDAPDAKARGKLTVQWQIRAPQTEKRYAFYIGDKAVATLRYDGQSAAWILKNETEQANETK